MGLKHEFYKILGKKLKKVCILMKIILLKQMQLLLISAAILILC